jgi:hypothetical protein
MKPGTGPIPCSLLGDRDSSVGKKKPCKSKNHEDCSPKEKEHPRTVPQEGDDGGTAHTNILNESWTTAQAAKAMMIDEHSKQHHERT